MTQEHGPSYYDVEQHVDYLRDRYGVGVNLLLVPPLYVRAQGRKTSWVVSARSWRLGKPGENTPAGQAAFGKGGAWKTLPAAALAALRDLESKLERVETERAVQATF